MGRKTYHLKQSSEKKLVFENVQGENIHKIEGYFEQKGLLNYGFIIKWIKKD